MSDNHALSWLLEDDSANPGVCFFALRDLLRRPAGDPELVAAQEAVMVTGPVPEIMKQQAPQGYWAEPAPNYGPKYRGTLWQLVFLAQLGADGRHPGIQTACDYVLTHYPAPQGGLSAFGNRSGLIHCMQGNLVAALIDLGWLDDERLQRGLDWMAHSVTGEGIAPSTDKSAEVRYLRSANSGPGFLCSANDHLPCAWGAVKVMLALGKVPDSHYTPAIRAAIDEGIDFLFSRDPAVADYPMGYATKPSLSWFRFGFPVFYVTDVLQNLEVLTALGYGGDPRLRPAIDLLLSKRDEHGRWQMAYTYNGKTWVDIEVKGKPSKWVTLRALRVLSHVPEFDIMTMV